MMGIPFEVRLVLAVLSTLLGAFVYLQLWRPRARVLRGRELLTDREVRRATRGGMSDQSGAPPNGVRWGGAPVPVDAETSHFLVCGTTGSGKTLTLTSLMRVALNRIGPGRDQRAVVYDAKQDMNGILASLGLSCPVISLNPFDANGAAWDIADDVDSPAAALQIATTLIPGEEGGTNRFFTDAARDLLNATMLGLMEAAPGKWTLRDVILTMKDQRKLEAVLGQTTGGAELFELYFAEPRTSANVFMTIRAALAPLEIVAALWSTAETTYSLKRFVEDDAVLVLGSNEEMRTAVDAINRVLFKRLTELLLSQGESRTRRTWMFLDEVREAGRLDGLSRLMTKGRSKGVCAVLGFQDIDGLRDAFGDKKASEITSMCSHKAFLRLESGETAKWAATLMGEFEAIEVHRSESAGILGNRRQGSGSEQRVKTDVVLSSEFLTLPPVTPGAGVTGYYMAPYTGSFRTSLSLSFYLGAAPEKYESSAEGEFRFRPTAAQFLGPFTEGDEERLGIVVAGARNEIAGGTELLPEGALRLPRVEQTVLPGRASNRRRFSAKGHAFRNSVKRKKHALKQELAKVGSAAPEQGV